MTAHAIGLRLGSRWAAAALEETEEVVAVEKTGREESDAWRLLVEAMKNTVDLVDEPWRHVLFLFEQGMVVTPAVRASVQSMRETITSTSHVLRIVKNHTRNHASDLDRVGEVIARYDREVSAVEAAMRFPAFDPERLRIGAEQSERGEVEDVARVIEAIVCGGNPLQ